MGNLSINGYATNLAPAIRLAMFLRLVDIVQIQPDSSIYRHKDIQRKSDLIATYTPEQSSRSRLAAGIHALNDIYLFGVSPHVDRAIEITCQFQSSSFALFSGGKSCSRRMQVIVTH